MWDADTGKRLHTFQGHTDNVDSVSFSADSKQALTGSWDGTAILWDIETKKQIQRFVVPKE